MSSFIPTSKGQIVIGERLISSKVIENREGTVCLGVIAAPDLPNAEPTEIVKVPDEASVPFDRDDYKNRGAWNRHAHVVAK
jgi:hypothetical protein